MKHGSTIILRGAVVLLGLVVLALCIFALPPAIIGGNFESYRPIFIGMYLPAIPFFIALYQTLQLLSYIDNNTVFSELSVKGLRVIKYCALIISGLYSVGLPYIFYVADKDDAPGVIVIALVIIIASFVIATAAAVLQRLIQYAVDIKAENDLTV
ncbi:MAG: DUF2975 domain-containing protein [Candidatus Kerfeldbacteria bacterium]|nr:DUF2975 domain-containing protein [Candidatus Kerfeldbacteria bacterium]